MSITESGISYTTRYDIAKIRKLFEFDGIHFWLVSGNRVHIFDPSWKNDKGEGEFVGGHHYVLLYIPENEIWINNNAYGDIYPVTIHEYVERLLMKEHKFSYSDAHRIASNAEEMYKRIEAM